MAGAETVVTITGINFVNTANGINYTSDVVIYTGAGNITVAPDSITAVEMVATIPSLVEGNCGMRVVKSGMNSNLVPIVVVPPVTIDSAAIRRDIVTIRGSGFGDESYNGFGVTVTCEGSVLESSIVTWDGTRIVVECSSTTAGDEVTVNALHGSDSATIG